MAMGTDSLGLRFWIPAVILIVVSSASGQPFVSPIGGTPYVDWTIVNYVDLDSSGGVLDYRSGNYSYDGHNAIDYALANFAKMDAGVPVYAAAAGTVISRYDGDGVITAADLGVWRLNFGRTAPTGATSGATVAETASLLLATMWLSIGLAGRLARRVPLLAKWLSQDHLKRGGQSPTVLG